MFVVMIIFGGLLALVALAFALDRDYSQPAEPLAPARARIALAAIIAVVAVASVVFRWLDGSGLQQSADDGHIGHVLPPVLACWGPARGRQLQASQVMLQTDLQAGQTGCGRVVVGVQAPILRPLRTGVSTPGRNSQGNVALPPSLIPAGGGRLRPALGRS